MMLRSNMHTHTNFSDGVSTAEETVQAALEKGFVSLGFSDHGVSTVEPTVIQDEQGYCAEIWRLKRKYQDQIEIVLGCEHEAFTREADLRQFEYLIESVHLLEKGGTYISIDNTVEMLKDGIDRYYAGDPYAMCRDYFDRVSQSMTDVKTDIVGHIGLVSKFNEQQPLFDHQDKRYIDCAGQTIALAAELDILVEINSGAMSRGYRSTPYPYLEQLKLLKELGGRIIITTDCHNAQWLDYGMDVSTEIAKEAGFRTSWIWKDGGFQEQPLE